jgi:hypothetical protein
VNLVDLCDAPAAEGESIGQIKFQRGAEVRAFNVCDTALAAPRIDTGLPVSVQRASQENGNAEYRFTGGARFEDMLNVIVQAVRAEHQFAFPGAFDIWFTGLRKFPLAVGGVHPATSGSLRLERQRIMGSAGAFQSLWAVTVLRDDGTTGNGYITFTFKSKETVNVG